MECVFCDIIARRIPAEIVYESDKVIAILDINPIHFGHALIIPKTHCRDFLTVPPDSYHDILRATHIVSQALVESFQLEGFNIFSNNGRIAGQSVFHFHMHVTPRFPGDDIRFILKLKSYSDGAMAEYAERIRAHIP
jgi:histidine triad (HIT) family protein